MKTLEERISEIEIKFSIKQNNDESFYVSLDGPEELEEKVKKLVKQCLKDVELEEVRSIGSGQVAQQMLGHNSAVRIQKQLHKQLLGEE